MKHPPDTHQQIFMLAHIAQMRAIRNRRQRERRKKILKPTGPNRSLKQRVGDDFELRACQHLEQAGLTLLARQLSCPRGEIDLILRQNNTLVFVEVRARSHQSHGGASASISVSKQLRVIRTAKWHLPALTQQFFNGVTPACRIDAVCFDGDTLQWIQDAFRLKQDK